MIRNELVDFFLSRARADIAKTTSELPYNTNPAGFKYPEFYTITHENLSPLCDIDYFHHENEAGVKARFEQSLLNVMEKIISDGLLLTLPREETLWIGINSAQYWYDHVRLIP